MTAISINRHNIQLICPVCKSQKNLKLPESIINQSENLTTISIPNGLICDHHFQAFVDKQFKVRGYQKVDFEIKEKNTNNIELSDNNKEILNNEDKELYENLILEGNYLEYMPKNNKNHIINENKREIPVMENIEMSLEEIYEEFWEFIDDDNYEFRQLILKDEIRRKALKSES